jgi:hypothetical protein
MLLLRLASNSGPPFSVFQVTGTTGMSHHIPPTCILLDKIKNINFIFTVFNPKEILDRFMYLYVKTEKHPTVTKIRLIKVN